MAVSKLGGKGAPYQVDAPACLCRRLKGGKVVEDIIDTISFYRYRQERKYFLAWYFFQHHAVFVWGGVYIEVWFFYEFI